jgi:hypothetical protein
MQFQPKTEEQIIAENLWPEGEYDFEIVKAEEKISKTKPDGSGGNPMIQLTVKIFSPEGKFRLVDDFLMEKMAFKLRHCADACRLLDKYNIGELRDTDFVGKAGRCEVVIQEGQKKPDGGKYPDKNTIKDYIKRTDTAVAASVAAKAKDVAAVDDEIPF